MSEYPSQVSPSSVRSIIAGAVVFLAAVGLVALHFLATEAPKFAHFVDKIK